MKNYDYKSVVIEIDPESQGNLDPVNETLAGYANDGWELVSLLTIEETTPPLLPLQGQRLARTTYVSRYRATFKRPIGLS
jgi:hypothetical protein